MSFDNFFSSLGISGSALTAQQTRMKVVAENIANANTTRTPEGGPYRRQEVVFSSVLKQEAGKDLPVGVKVDSIQKSTEAPISVYDPGHPDADATGHVLVPNVSVPKEMIDMIAASRAYEANLAAVKNFKSMAQKALAIAK